jgi:hypothetical protein
VAAYARDLRCYHAACANRPVYPILVPTSAGATPRAQDGVVVVGPAGVHQVLVDLTRKQHGPPISREEFLSADAYSPLPSLVRAARDLFHHRPLPKIWRARAATDPAVDAIVQIARDAAATKTRRLVLLTGVPGAGKSLVGLRLVHGGFLDELVVERAGGKPPAPAVFLSGNGPLVEVLQDALKDAGGGGKTFVRGVKEYVRYYTKRPMAVPAEHLLVFDEAQRAWDADQVAEKHEHLTGEPKSEPEHFVEFSERIPEWCVVLGLIGSGQEIHKGEEGGLGQWRKAVEGCAEPGRWTVHAPEALRELFQGEITARFDARLSLTVPVRYHTADMVDAYVSALVDTGDAGLAKGISQQLDAEGHRWIVTRDLEFAKDYARSRYSDAPEARFGLLASSKDKDLIRFGVDNSFQTTKRLRVGPWYNAAASDRQSCCQLEEVATEFSSQGLELDLAILAWGTDFIRDGQRWSCDNSRGTRGKVKDAFQLRTNVYRVLLTRGRDGTVVFVPPDPRLDQTYQFLVESGMRAGDGGSGIP